MSGVTYDKPDEEMKRLLAKVIKEHHKRLLDADVQVLLLVAYGPVNEDGETIGPAIQHAGVPALGVAKIIKLPHRVAGLGDAEITIDGDWWAEASARERMGLLDHELTHLEVVHESVLRKPKRALEVVEGDDGTIKLKRDQQAEEETASKPVLDSAGRPKMRIRKHDRYFGWFDEVAKRWGPDSQESQQAQRFVEETGQLYFGGEWKAAQP